MSNIIVAFDSEVEYEKQQYGYDKGTILPEPYQVRLSSCLDVDAADSFHGL